MATTKTCGCAVTEHDSPYKHNDDCPSHPEWFENVAVREAKRLMRDPQARRRAVREAVYAMHGTDEGVRLMAAALLVREG